MKLRNKKTGEIWTLTNRNEGTSAVLWVSNGSQTHVIESIEELANNFEDYEEPKEHWFIDSGGEVVETTYITGYDKTILKKFGNYFETREEAEKVVEKLKAWKRLKDKGLHVTTFYVEDGSLVIRAKTHNSSGAENWDDLDLLFGGER